MSTPWPRTWNPATPATASEPSRPATIGGISTADLASQFGTPLFVVDLDDLDARMNAVVSAANETFGGADVYYASKAFTSTAMLRRASAAGMRVDVASGGELAVALAAGVPGSDIGLHGNNKSVEEIDAALAAGVGRIIADSESELELINERATLAGVIAPVFLRITTGVHAGANEYIATAHEDQKFGLSYSSGAAMAAARMVMEAPNLELIGLHMHIGSQIFGSAAHVASVKVLLDLRVQIAAEFDVVLPEVDLGGGYGITYVDEEVDPIASVMAEVAAAVAEHSRESGLAQPRISLEPGRSVVGPAMVSLYSVGTIKDITVDDGQRRYVAFDGGMTDNVLRPMLYGSQYITEVANRVIDGDGVRSRLVGKHCESGDIMIRDLQLPDGLKRGDILAIPATGAYGRSMANNYNMLTRPPVVAVKDGQAEVWLRRETVEDLLRLDPGV